MLHRLNADCFKGTVQCKETNHFKENDHFKTIYRFIAYLGVLSLSLFAVLQLKGCAAAAVSGAATSVALVKDRRTTGTIVEDQSIEFKAIHALAQNKTLWKESHLTPISYNNVLLLVGQAPNENLKHQAEDALRDIPKIRKVYNELSVAEPASITTRSKDSWITTQIKAKILGKKDVSASNIKVVTENGVVYLMGLTTSEEEIAATEIARNVPGVEKVVQIFERT